MYYMRATREMSASMPAGLMTPVKRPATVPTLNFGQAPKQTKSNRIKRNPVPQRNKNLSAGVSVLAAKKRFWNHVTYQAKRGEGLQAVLEQMGDGPGGAVSQDSFIRYMKSSGLVRKPATAARLFRELELDVDQRLDLRGLQVFFQEGRHLSDATATLGAGKLYCQSPFTHRVPHRGVAAASRKAKPATMADYGGAGVRSRFDGSTRGVHVQPHSLQGGGRVFMVTHQQTSHGTHGANGSVMDSGHMTGDHLTGYARAYNDSRNRGGTRSMPGSPIHAGMLPDVGAGAGLRRFRPQLKTLTGIENPLRHDHLYDADDGDSLDRRPATSMGLLTKSRSEGGLLRSPPLGTFGSSLGDGSLGSGGGNNGSSAVGFRASARPKQIKGLRIGAADRGRERSRKAPGKKCDSMVLREAASSSAAVQRRCGLPSSRTARLMKELSGGGAGGGEYVDKKAPGFQRSDRLIGQTDYMQHTKVFGTDGAAPT